MKRILLSGLVLFLCHAAAHASNVTFSPSPPVAGEPIVVTYHGVTRGCGPEGVLTLETISGGGIFLSVESPGCEILPISSVNYTASTTLDPLPAGTYYLYVRQLVRQTYVLQAFEVLEVKSAPVCSATETSLCLGDGRFEVTGEWTDFEGNEGVAHTAPDDFKGLGNYGTFWFFTADNPEMVAKVIDGCSLNGHYWVFLSPASTVKYDITVRDVRSGQQKTYSNALGTVPTLVADTSAFACGS